MSASGDFGPAPAGVNLSDTQVPTVYAAIIITAVCGTSSVLLRFYTRLTLANGLDVDDWLILCGLVSDTTLQGRNEELTKIAKIVTWGTAIASFCAIPNGLGHHMWILKIDDFNHLWENLFAYVIIYVIAVSFTKLSIACLYRRIFALEKVFWFFATMVVLYPMTVIIVILNSCKPLSYFWTQYTDPTAKGTCIKVATFFFANGIWAACIDLGLLIVPVPLVWSLKMGLRQKLACLGVFMLGSFVVFASIVRIWMLHNNQHSDDPVWGITPVYVWSSVEPFVGIICACLPTLSPLFKRFWAGHKTSGGASSGNQSPYPNTLDTIGGTRNKHNKWLVRLRPDDEIMLTTHAGTQVGNDRQASDENISDTHQSIQMTKDFDVDWSSQKHLAV